jgi:hypothetical protein
MADDEELEGESEPEDYLSGSVVQAELSADDYFRDATEMYEAVVAQLRQTMPDIDERLQSNPQLVQTIWDDTLATWSSSEPD